MLPLRMGPDDCYARISNPALKIWKRTRNMPSGITTSAYLTNFPLSATSIKTRLSLCHLLLKTRPVLRIWNECIFVLTAHYIFFHQNSYYNAIFLVLLSYYTNTTDWVAYKYKRNIFNNLETKIREPWFDKDPSRLQTPNLLLCPHLVEGTNELCGVCLLRALVTFKRALLSWPKHLP